jgi:hypothetical protein
MADVSQELVLIQGSTKDFDILLFDQNDSPESLAGADQATFAVKETVDAGTNILLRRTADANLTITAASGKLTATLTQVESDALKPGTYIGEAAVRFPGPKWLHTDPFFVRIQPPVAPNTP